MEYAVHYLTVTLGCLLRVGKGMVHSKLLGCVKFLFNSCCVDWTKIS